MHPIMPPTGRRHHRTKGQCDVPERAGGGQTPPGALWGVAQPLGKLAPLGRRANGELGHDLGALHFHRPFRRAKLRTDLLVEPAGDDAVENLAPGV
jgi:hypothetical protein